MKGSKKFKKWQFPEFDEKGMTKWNWMCQYHENLKIGKSVDTGAFTYINARFGVEIGVCVQIGSHCSIYSHSTIDNKKGKIVVKNNARIGSHSVIMPGVTVGENAIIGAFSFVNKDIPENSIAYGQPVEIVRKMTVEELEKY